MGKEWSTGKAKIAFLRVYKHVWKGQDVRRVLRVRSEESASTANLYCVALMRCAQGLKISSKQIETLEKLAR